MLDFQIITDKKNNTKYIETSINGKFLLNISQLNKGTAFTQEERHTFSLLGKLPHRVEQLSEQVQRAYLQYSDYKTKLQKSIYLNNLHDKNQILFYKLLSAYLDEMLPIIYTPVVSISVQKYSHKYRQPRGLYITHLDIDYIDEILNNRSNPDIDLIVVTDGEGVLGIGDQGVGGMDIPIAKLMVYSLCGGIDPLKTLPITLDIGTNNQTLLNDSLYLGCRNARITGKQYDIFITKFVEAINRHFPKVFLHWEDFGLNNARRILENFQDKLCSFNDDIQGTGAVTIAALLAACDITKNPLVNNKIIIFGAGTAGIGIADQIVDALVRLGSTESEAVKNLWLIDRQGLIVQSDNTINPAQKKYARQNIDIETWQYNTEYPSLLETIENIQPTVLIGCSAQYQAFSQKIIQTMTTYCDMPIIFPLSNPDEKCEAVPNDILIWSQGKALIATGTEFNNVKYNDISIRIAQCNNALIFPGLGLGILAVGAKRLTKNMIWSAVYSLKNNAPCLQHPQLPLLPALGDAQAVAKNIAIAVAKSAIHEGLATKNQNVDLLQLIDQIYWIPEYLPYKESKNAKS